MALLWIFYFLFFFSQKLPFQLLAVAVAAQLEMKSTARETQNNRYHWRVDASRYKTNSAYSHLHLQDESVHILFHFQGGVYSSK